MGRLIEVGTPIGITRRNQTKSIVIRLYNCGFQYQRVLKTERYDKKQVVLLVSLNKSYQGFNLEGNQKYGGGDTSESSLVFCCSKDNGAGRRATTFKIRKHKKPLHWCKIHKRKSARQSLETGDYIVVRCSRP